MGETGVEMTPGEIGRVLDRIDKALTQHDQKLDAVLLQTTKTNGRVDRHDDQIRGLEQTVSWAWRAIIGLNITVAGGVIVYYLTHP